MTPRPRLAFFILGISAGMLSLYFNARMLNVDIFTEVGSDVSDRLTTTQMLRLTLLPIAVGIASGLFGATFCFARSMYTFGVAGGVIAILIMPEFFDGGIYYLFWKTAWAPILMLLPLMWFAVGLLFTAMDLKD